MWAFFLNQREDEGHVFKEGMFGFQVILCTFDTMQRIGQSTWRGGPNNMKLERFNEALYDRTTKLTYPGQRKQSIRDIEILRNLWIRMDTQGMFEQ